MRKRKHSKPEAIRDDDLDATGDAVPQSYDALARNEAAQFNPKELTIDRGVPWQRKAQ